MGGMKGFALRPLGQMPHRLTSISKTKKMETALKMERHGDYHLPKKNTRTGEKRNGNKTREVKGPFFFLTGQH